MTTLAFKLFCFRMIFSVARNAGYPFQNDTILFVKRASSLRSQLILGLGIMLLVSTISASIVTEWSTRRQIAEIQLSQAEVVGQAVALIFSFSDTQPDLQRMVTHLTAGPFIDAVDVIDKDNKLLATSRIEDSSKIGNRFTSPELTRVLGTGAIVKRIIDSPKPLLEITIPLQWKNGRLGAVRMRMPFASGIEQSRLLFWVLMGSIGFVLILFVAFVVTRYVAQPVEKMEQAAGQLAKGDLGIQLPETGAYELLSLAKSFNKMTVSLREHMKQLEDQRQQLITSEKLASVGRLATGIAHEVGNPLQSIVGFTDILLKGELEKEEQKDSLSRIQSEAQRIHGIVRQLLDYARPLSDVIESVSLDKVIDQAVQLVIPQKKMKGIEIEKCNIENLPNVAANRQRIVQVLVNILLNAADAIQGTGQIKFEGHIDGDNKKIELHISNTGISIPQKDREKIFDPFFTTKDPGKGTGMGLAVCRSIVESYGGKLTLSDAIKTIFIIQFVEYKV